MRNAHLCLPLALVLMASMPIAAQEEGSSQAEEERVGLAIDGILGTQLSSKYFFRGILQENRGLIVQPFLDLTAHVHEDAGSWLRSVDLNIGIWNSLHDGPTGTGGPTMDPRAWYELDFYTGVSFGLGENFSFGPTYTAYISPNDSFSTIHEVMFSLSYDDGSLWGDSFGGLQPHVGVAFEAKNQADGGSSRGIYLELGIAPSFEIYEHESYPITLTVPVTLGLSLSDYYEGPGSDDTFGYLDVGLDAAVPLAFMGTRMGSWELSAGVHVLILGDNNQAINGGDGFEVIGSVGFSVNF